MNAQIHTTTNAMPRHSNSVLSESSSIRTRVVVIGNGPSGIATSVMLSGYLPTWNGKRHPSSQLLTAKLQASTTSSLIDMDLVDLSEGLTGRTLNEVSILFDQLFHPDADIDPGNGTTCLNWECDRSRGIDHVVVGSGLPGGSWHSFQRNMLALSYAEWMELPGYGILQWAEEHGRTDVRECERPPRGAIADYYHDFIHHMGICSSFASGYRLVKSVRRLDNGLWCVSGEILREHWEELNGSIGCVCRHRCSSRHVSDDQDVAKVSNPSPIVEPSLSSFSYITDKLILATGIFDSPKKLNITGETMLFVHHRLATFKTSLSTMTSPNDVALIVGSGLSAADCASLAMKAGLAVVHVMREDVNSPDFILSSLPRSEYPDYAAVLSAIKGNLGTSRYETLHGYRIERIYSDGRVSLRYERNDRDSEVMERRVSVVAVMIGARPDLSFLPCDVRRFLTHSSFTEEETAAFRSPRSKKKSSDISNLSIPTPVSLHSMKQHTRMCSPIDQHTNPVLVDPFAFATKTPGLYALGPIVADNFVRYIIGGALAITTDLLHSSSNK